MRIRLSAPALLALSALSACTLTTVDRRPVVYRPARPPPAEPPPPVVYEPPPPVVYEPSPPPPVVYENRAMYRYYGPHHIPDSVGGGWCYVDGVHDHDFPPENPSSYRVEGGVYYYSAPLAITFYDGHPDNHGGWCTLHGPHRHDYYPPRHHHTSFVYDREHRHYVYQEHPAAPARVEPESHHHWGEPHPSGPVHSVEPVGPNPGYYHDAHPVGPPPGHAGHMAEPPPHAGHMAEPPGHAGHMAEPPPHAGHMVEPPPHAGHMVEPPAHVHPAEQPQGHFGSVPGVGSSHSSGAPSGPGTLVGPGQAAAHPAAPSGAGHISGPAPSHSVRQDVRPQATPKPDDSKKHRER